MKDIESMTAFGIHKPNISRHSHGTSSQAKFFSPPIAAIQLPARFERPSSERLWLKSTHIANRLNDCAIPKPDGYLTNLSAFDSRRSAADIAVPAELRPAARLLLP